jgi:hypothetical protein
VLRIVAAVVMFVVAGVHCIVRRDTGCINEVCEVPGRQTMGGVVWGNEFVGPQDIVERLCAETGEVTVDALE